MNAPSTSRHTKRRLRTRDALVAAAEELFAANGPDAISIDEIVTAADVAKGSFYNHFEDKDAIAREIARALRAELEEKLTALNAGIDDAAERVARALCFYTAFAQRKPKRARTMLHVSPGATDPDAPLNQGLSRDIASGIARSRFNNVTREAGMLFVIGAVQASFQRALTAERASAQRTAAQMSALLLRGLGLSAREAKTLAAAAALEAFAHDEEEE